MRLELSRRAQADLDDIRDFSVERFGISRAVRYLDAIENAFRRILTFPDLGTVHEAVKAPVRSLGCEQHRIFYVVDGERIEVVRVLHKAVDVESRL